MSTKCQVTFSKILIYVHVYEKNHFLFVYQGVPMVLVFHRLKFFIPSLSSHVNDICKDIISIRLRCGSNNISKVFISSIAYSSQINTVLMQILNRALYDECRDLVLHPLIIFLLLKMIFGLMEFVCKKAVNALLPIIWSTALIIFSNLQIRSGGIYEDKSFIVWIWKC